MTTQTRTLWEDALSVWKALGPPLRPCAEDLRAYLLAANPWIARCGAPRVLVLGATPEFASLPWPTGTNVVAADRSAMMLEQVWPGFPNRGQGAVVADWLALPLEAGSRDIVLGDGSFTPFDFPNGHIDLFRAIHRVLSPQGRAVIRFFLQSNRSETTQAVLRDVLCGYNENFHVLKWRFTMSLQTSVQAGVRLACVFRHWEAAGIGDQMIQQGLYHPDVMATMDWYQDREQRYTFPTLTDLRHAFEPWFHERSICFPSYPLGDRFPVITLEPRRVAA